MPTAARLVAAVCLALIAFLVSGMVIPLMPEGMDFGYFTWVNVVLGVLCGWIVMGKRAGHGLTGAINNGLTGGAALIFWGLFVQGTYEMVRRAMKNRYDGPFEALLSIFEIGFEYGTTIFVPNIIATVLVGSVLAGLATEQAWRQWR
ncbi:tellurium resistance protein [Phaeobacter gallaeciensis]|uniref:Tellurium resistance protein n=2 Tax=Roseobacteraceae TaxID=2854170 RepID=A0A366WP02_9RHOB|nr:MULTISPECIES: TrgA family protein [Roseobacteraceae]MBT3140357.1 TrgA family protein [Falsiruegeria litorea]MBT8171142.1 TrgA family protein [Falsiruegeria litorea]RBW51755.1 tellurium resistance protein [Phaeobacter gallaeciensis]